MENPEARHRVVVPEYAPKFPNHLSLTRLLYYSVYALKRIKAIVKGRPAYIVPGVVRPGERALLTYRLRSSASAQVWISTGAPRGATASSRL